MDQFYEPFFCFFYRMLISPQVAQHPLKSSCGGGYLGVPEKAHTAAHRGEHGGDGWSRPPRGGSVIGSAQFVGSIHACFSFGACTIQSRRFWLSSNHFAISNIFVLACILSMRRLVSNRSQMLSSVSKPMAFIGSSSSGNTCATVPPSPAARIAFSSRSRSEMTSCVSPTGMSHAVPMRKMHSMGLHIEAGMEHQQCQSLFCNVHLKILCAINRHVCFLLFFVLGVARVNTMA